jgi:hypothetical protein
MIEPHPQDKEFLDLCKQLDNKIGIVLVMHASDPGMAVVPNITPQAVVAIGLNSIVNEIAAATHIKPTLLPIIGTIPDHTRMAGLRYALKVVLVDEELVKREAAKVAP